MVRKVVCITKSFLITFTRFLLEDNYLCFSKSSWKFVCSRKQLPYWYQIPWVSHILWSCLCLHLILWICSARLLARLNNELVINLALSVCHKPCAVSKFSSIRYCFMNFFFSFLSILLTSFCIGIEKVMYFFVLPPK